MKNLGKFTVLLLVSVLCVFGPGGCRSSGKNKEDHPRAEHPKGDHPKGDHPKH